MVTDRRMPIVISSSKIENKTEWPFPGFSQNLIGATTGEEKVLNYTYPETSDYKDLRGKDTDSPGESRRN